MLQLSRSSRCPLTRHAWKRGLEELPVNSVEEEQHDRTPLIDSWQRRLPFVSGRFRRYRKMVSLPGGLPQRTSSQPDGRAKIPLKSFDVLLFSRRKLDGISEHDQSQTAATPIKATVEITVKGVLASSANVIAIVQCRNETRALSLPRRWPPQAQGAAMAKSTKEKEDEEDEAGHTACRRLSYAIRFFCAPKRYRCE